MRNLVICCDGTNNQLSTAPTNVLRLFDCLDLKDKDRQVAFYDPGVGTLAHAGLTNPIAQQLSLVYGLAFGVGFMRNLEEAYRFLMYEYRPGDRIFLFGFSRGAFTVRAIAGMLHMFGLLRVEHENLLPYLSRAYAGANWDVVKRTLPFTRRPIRIDFLGLWDSVSSLGFSYSRQTLPFTANNPSVHVIRQALAIDERRTYFRQNLWGRKYAYKQDIKEVWFAGVHSDVGGGYEETEGALPKIPFAWIVAEARRPGAHTGLLIDQKAYEVELNGDSGDLGPDAGGLAHESLTGAWWIMEFLPKNATLKRDDFSLPLGQRRVIEGDPDHPVVLHQSVVDRMTAAGSNYHPANLTQPPSSVEPWSATPAPTAPIQPTPLGARLSEFFKASAWVVGFYYALFGLLHLVGHLTLFVTHYFVCDRKPDWGLSVGDVIVWPWPVAVWTVNADHAWALLVWVFPFVVIFGGAWLQGLMSGLTAFTSRVSGKLLHLRWAGYDSADAKKQFSDLRADGVLAYRRALRIDLLFPFCYGAALIASLHEAHRLAHLAPGWLEALFPWVLGLPLLTAVADWLENAVLLWQIGKFQEDADLSAPALGVASVATSVKIATFALSGVLLAILILAWLFPCAS